MGGCDTPREEFAAHLYEGGLSLSLAALFGEDSCRKVESRKASTMESGNLHSLLTLARSGDERAGDQAFREVSRLLTIFVRAGMGHRLRDHRESADVCQSIARSFIEDHAAGAVKFENEAALVGYLKTVVRSKLAMLARHDGAMKRGGGAARVGLDQVDGVEGEMLMDGSFGMRVSGDSVGGAGSVGGVGGVGSMAGASQLGDDGGSLSDVQGKQASHMAGEGPLDLVREEMSEQDQEIARMRLAGLSWEQIAIRLSQDATTLRKRWSRLAERINERLSDG